MGSPFDASIPLVQQREKVVRQARFIPMPPRVEIQPISIGELYAEWVGSPGFSTDEAILYLHGGGYTMCSCDTHRALASRIAIASQSAVLLIDYRLAPENPFPAALEDAQSAFQWLLDQGIDPGRIVVAGDSAGGGLALATVVSFRDDRRELPAGIVCISPWADLTCSGETYVSCAETDPLISLESSRMHASRYCGEHDPQLPLISPVYADLSGFPPLLIMVGEHELLRSDSESLAENALQAGARVNLEVWDGMWHVWLMYAGMVPEAQQAIARIGSFIRERLSNGLEGPTR